MKDLRKILAHEEMRQTVGGNNTAAFDAPTYLCPNCNKLILGLGPIMMHKLECTENTATRRTTKHIKIR